jgi:NTE family protein
MTHAEEDGATASDRPVWVLGGGGVTGIAWEIGIIAGLADEGVVISPLATIIGTSAGAVVGAQVTGGSSPDELYRRQQNGVPWETSRGLGLRGILALTRVQLFARTPEQAARRIGRAALRADIRDRAASRAIVQARLPDARWGDADLWVVAVDAGSGARRVFTRTDGVPLLDAVAASCAVPLSTAPVVIDGHSYMDGGMRSTLNLDLAAGSGPVIALAPSTAAIGPWARIPAQRAGLGVGRAVEILYRDEASRRAQGRDVMDRSVVPALVAAAREQGRREARRVANAVGTGPVER